MISSQAQQATEQAQIQPRTGLIPLVIGASRMVRGADGRKRQYEAKSLREVAMTTRAEKREIQTVCMCFDCEKTYATETEFRLDPKHVSDEEMRRDKRAHVFAFFSADNEQANAPQLIDALTKEIAGLERVQTKLVAELAKIDDYEALQKARARIEDVAKARTDAIAKRDEMAQAIIGIISDTAA